MEATRSRPPSYQAGFTLVEIMVGLTIGLLATLVIVQVMSAFETQKRVTTGSADAQTNGGISLYTIGRDLQMAGYPLMPVTNSPLECTSITYGGSGITSISPVTITDGTSDTITIRYGDSSTGGISTPVTAMSAPSVTVNSNFGCVTGDIALITKGQFCAFSSVSSVPATISGITPTVTLGDSTPFVASAAGSGTSLACLGKWNEIIYSVVGGNLLRNGTPIVVGIVNLQAQYGISATASSNTVTLWVDATGGTWAAPVTADRNRIKAIRIAVVARNQKREPAAVTTPCAGVSLNGPCAWTGSASSPAPTIDLSTADADWAQYRYRVFETIFPLRNVIWSKNTL
jgi:type IV pilus assembly protein PilW